MLGPVGSLLFRFLLLLSAVGLFAQDIRVTSSKQIIANGGRVSWGAKNNLLAYDSLGTNGFYDVYISNPDGTGARCLTCGVSTLPPYNKGNPEWHPSSQFLALEVQYKTGAIPRNFTPGVGVGNDLYITDAAGKSYWQVTYEAAGVLHPRFSHDGNKLLWVQRTSTLFSDFWNLMLGDFSVDSSGVPHVTNIRSLPPCANNVFCETGGWSLDDSTVFFTGTLDGQSTTGIDIYSYNLSSGVTARLTNTPGNWDEFPTPFPSGHRLLWMSGVMNASTGLKTEYWTMNYDGSDKVQLTYFNDSAVPAWYTGRAVTCARVSWSPDGSQIAAYLIPNGTTLGQTGSNYVLNLEPAAAIVSSASYARPPLSQDAIVSAFYPNLAATTAAATDSTLPISLGGANISVTDSLGTARPASLFYVTPGQVNWEIPSGTAPGPATVEIANGSGSAVRATVDVEAAGPGLFTATGTGAGAAAGYLLVYAAGASTPTRVQTLYGCVGGSCTVQPVNLGDATDSDYLVLFGTGFRHAASLAATLGGKSVVVSASGAQGMYSGLDQINLQVPHSFAGAGTVSLNITAGLLSATPGAPANVVSNTVEVAFQ